MHPSKGPRQDHSQRGRSAAIYGRSATTGRSISTQREACQAFARQYGYAVPEDYICLDDGVSGMVLERPGLQRLRELIRARAIDAVIVADLARLSRTVSHQLLLADECHDAEVTVHVVPSSNMPTRDDFSPLLTTLRRPREREELTDEPTA